MSAKSTFKSSDETWERFLAVHEGKPSASVRECALCPTSPDGLTELGGSAGPRERVEALEEAK